MKQNYTYIDSALKDGCKLHGFRSGGGLRVLCLEHKEKKFYGEGHCLSEALRILNDDVEAGGRNYYDVYNGKIETHYMTGSYSSDEDQLDMWVYSGKKFDVEYIDNQIVIDMSSEEDIKCPKAIQNECYKDNTEIYWKPVGHKHTFVSKSTTFADGFIGCITCPVGSWLGVEKIDERVHVSRIVKEETFNDALIKAEKYNMFKYESEWFICPIPEVN